MNERWVTSEIDISVPPERIIEAFTLPHLLEGWWGVERSFVERKEGGIYLLLWGISASGIKYISSGIIAAYNPQTKIHIDRYMYINPERPVLGPLQLLVDAVETPQGAKAFVKQGPYPLGRGPEWEWYFEAVEKAWPEVLKGFKSYLEANA